MSLLAAPATGSPHARHTAAAALQALCSPDQGNEPPGTCAGSWWAGEEEEEEVRAAEERQPQLASPCPLAAGPMEKAASTCGLRNGVSRLEDTWSCP